MPAPSVEVPCRAFVDRSVKHERIVQGFARVDPSLQKLLVELVMLRLFDEFQEAISGVAFRLACGAPYGDGTMPNLLINPAKSAAGAKDLFENHGRSRMSHVKWSKAKFINETTKYVIDPSDPFSSICSVNGSVIADMQIVRNRIAHSSSSSRARFGDVVQRHYGARLNLISPGSLLLSPRFQPLLVEQYIVACRTIVRECARV